MLAPAQPSRLLPGQECQSAATVGPANRISKPAHCRQNSCAACASTWQAPGFGWSLLSALVALMAGPTAVTRSHSHLPDSSRRWAMGDDDHQNTVDNEISDFPAA